MDLTDESYLIFHSIFKWSWKTYSFCQHWGLWWYTNKMARNI